MTDDLADLKAALQQATPDPDPARRAANLALAQKNFEKIQGSAEAPRPTSDRHRRFGWLISGGFKMFQSLTTRGGLAATTALVALGLVVVLPQGRNLLAPPAALPPTQVAPLPALEKSAPAPKSRPQLRREIAPAETEAPASPDDRVAPMMAQEQPTLGLLASPSVLADVAPAPAPEGFARREADLRTAPDTEAFANAPPASLTVTADDPVSTFSIDVDTASYAVVRSSLMAGFLPPPEAVRIEEMINYFPYDYAAPAPGDAPFRANVSVMATPWNANTQLVHIALQGRLPALADRPPLNLVFLIDTSGSMQSPDKLPLLKQSFRLMLGQLRPQDQVAIVAYAGSAGQVLEPTPATERATILAALDHLQAGGSTAGQEGLQQAYSLAAKMTGDGEVSRVILATDGDFNVGIYDPEALKSYIASKRDSGTYLSVLGFGRGNLDDATMQALAQNGNGTAAYIDTLNEAQKVLVDQLSGALFPIAGDVKVQVEFNPATVAEYRLIGYETRALKREDFNNDKVDAGDIGAGHSVTALYEITPVGSAAVLNDPLRYGQDSADNAARATSDELGYLRLRYKNPGESDSNLIEMPIDAGTGPADSEARFAAAIAGFGQLLRGSAYLGDWSWGDAIALANGAIGKDGFGYRRQAVNLMRLAQSLSAQ
jgi:Ca-activated chloride channel homolog